MKKNQGFAIFEIKATQTVSSSLFKEMERYEQNAAPDMVTETLIYRGNENENRTEYNVLSGRNI